MKFGDFTRNFGQDHLETFFASVATLMENQLRDLTTRSIHQMEEYFARFRLAPGQSQGAVTAAEVRFLTEIVDDFRRFVDEIWRF